MPAGSDAVCPLYKSTLWFPSITYLYLYEPLGIFFTIFQILLSSLLRRSFSGFQLLKSPTMETKLAPGLYILNSTSAYDLLVLITRYVICLLIGVLFVIAIDTYDPAPSSFFNGFSGS